MNERARISKRTIAKCTASMQREPFKCLYQVALFAVVQMLSFNLCKITATKYTSKALKASLYLRLIIEYHSGSTLITCVSVDYHRGTKQPRESLLITSAMLFFAACFLYSTTIQLAQHLLFYKSVVQFSSVILTYLCISFRK